MNKDNITRIDLRFLSFEFQQFLTIEPKAKQLIDDITRLTLLKKNKLQLIGNSEEMIVYVKNCINVKTEWKKFKTSDLTIYVLWYRTIIKDFSCH